MGKSLFEAADKDDNGTWDKEEVKEALHAMGFKFIQDKQINTIFKKADQDNNDVIDFEEFVKETPKTLRVSLVKLAKQNGHDLGFLAYRLAEKSGLGLEHPWEHRRKRLAWSGRGAVARSRMLRRRVAVCDLSWLVVVGCAGW